MFRFLTAGESHGPCLTAVIDGVPAGLAIDVLGINNDLARRQQGYGRGGRMKIEKDKVEILSGVRFGQTIGSPLTLAIRNRDWDNWQDRMSVEGEPVGPLVTSPRPGHADLPGVLKYERQDVRDILERASARETAARVAVGAVAKQLLATAGIAVVSHVVNIGGVSIGSEFKCSAIELADKVAASDLGCADSAAEVKMREAIDKAKENGDTLGGIFEVIVTGVMPGLGTHVQWDRRLDTKLSGALMSIQAIKGVEIGNGFGFAALPGSLAHDEIFFDLERGYYRGSNRAGGIEGGISNGEDIVIRAVMKPIPTLMVPLASVDIVTKTATKANTERSDACAVTAAAVVGEAMASIVLADAILEKFGGDTTLDLVQAVESYRARLGAR
ncbi:MAG: aroC [Firmicutes bacterium]|nr:aroC [Bacillota bacterium]